MQPKTRLAVYEYLALGCGLLAFGCNDVTRPDTDVCLVNAQLLHETCYNLLRDYNDDGTLKPDAKPIVRQYVDAAAMLGALNKGIRTDPDGWAHLKAYIRELRDVEAMSAALKAGHE